MVYAQNKMYSSAKMLNSGTTARHTITSDSLVGFILKCNFQARTIHLLKRKVYTCDLRILLGHMLPCWFQCLTNLALNSRN